jgi:hypothetical protein
MQVADLQEDLRACIVFGLQEPYPHAVFVVINDEQAMAEAIWGWDIHMTPNV